jgi:hypothetical protein
LLEAQLEEAVARLQQIEATIVEQGSSADISPEAQKLREAIQQLDAGQAESMAAVRHERATLVRLNELVEQLKAQTSRLTRAIVSETKLLDFEFVVCPRCGTALQQDRGSDATCLLCLQPPSEQAGREDLIREQTRIEAQLSETEELLGVHKVRIEGLESQDRRRSNAAFCRTTLIFRQGHTFQTRLQ